MLKELKYDHGDVSAEIQKIGSCNKIGEQTKTESGRVLRDQTWNLDFISTLDSFWSYLSNRPTNFDLQR